MEGKLKCVASVRHLKLRIPYYYMAMSSVQIRLTKKQISELDSLINKGSYPSRSEAVRDAVRKLIN